MGSSETTLNKETRDALRAEAKKARAELPAPYRAHKSAEICKRLEESLELTLGITATDPKDAVIAVYAAFREEVNLDDFIAYAYQKGCTVAFPCMVKDAWGIPNSKHREDSDKHAQLYTQQTMEMRGVSSEQFFGKTVPYLNNPLKRYTHDDKELDAHPYYAADELTMLVVPVVGFDKHGNRLGYGAGNYDRYLAQVPSSCRIAGVAFSEQEVDPIPTEEHDVPLPIISL